MGSNRSRGGDSGISRRDFLKISATAAAVTGCGLEFAYDPVKAAAYESSPDHKVTFSTCPYCSACCGQRVVVDKNTGEVVDIYGDFESPINQGGLCAKGAGTLQLVNNARRIGAWSTHEEWAGGVHPVPNIDGTMDNIFAAVTESGPGDRSINDFSSGVAYRRVGNGNWSRVGLDYAMDDIAARFKAARAADTAGWVSDTAGGNSKSVAFMGSSHLNNEQNWAYRKLIAEFGTSNVEHQARICHSTTVAGLAPAFGRGAMSNNWTDIGNTTLFVSMGGNPAENHPASMAHINRARRGPHTWSDRAGNTFTTNKPAAKLVVIEPRKTRTALQADLFVRIRPGTDIAFINGLLNYILGVSGPTGLEAPANANRKARFVAFHEDKGASRTFIADDGTTTTTGTGTWPKYSDALFKVNAPSALTADYERETRLIGGKTVSNVPVIAASIDEPGSVMERLKAHVAPYTQEVVADICGCSTADIRAVGDLLIENSRCSSVLDDADPYSATVHDPKSAGFRSTTFGYAMGLTQHTNGGMNVKAFATIQTVLGNMGRAGGGINAMRGIHNVQGSTDMGLLYHLIPGYSGNPTGTFSSYMNSLYGNRLDGTTAYTFANAGLQQKGFWNMTKAFFGDSSFRTGAISGLSPISAMPEDQTTMDALYGLWPKGNGDNHIKMFRKMQPDYVASDKITALLVWGQNPAVTEPAQGQIREGLKELDTLVVVDMFETETASCDRKATGVTYLLPACSAVEEAGSATNSGRALQWRYAATAPRGNSKADIELIMRLADAFNRVNAFDHIKTAWTALGYGAWDPYTKLWGDQYGWTPGTGPCDSEAVATKIHKQMAAPLNSGGALWLVLDGYNTTTTDRGGDWPAIGDPISVAPDGLTYDGIRARSRGLADLGAGALPGKDGNLLYKNWGYAWLVNRRVLYNQTTDVPGDQADIYQGPEQVARLFVSTNGSVIDYATTYRTVHRMSDVPVRADGTTPAIHVLPGRFPAHTEPYETPRNDLVAIWGKNATTNSAVYWTNPSASYQNLVYPGTTIGDVADFPLVLTTFRCVEHFQGGPITRNNWWNVEQEPEPWIEINSADALKYGIKDGDMVKIVTARTEALANDSLESLYPRALYGSGFRARVGGGLQSNQRVGRGVVGIPFHWGDRGLSTGSRANDLTIDAGDANTMMPEYKACLCRIEKL